MMAVFGWICLVVMMLAVTASWFIMWLNHGGQYTIGGAENSLGSRIAINVAGIAVAGVWYLAFTEVPFTVSMK
jgi:hypothetical protein